MINKVFCFRVIVVVLIGLLCSCSMVQTQQTKELEKLLIAAGFNVTFSNTPEKLTYLKTLSQNKIVLYNKDESNFYIYADAAVCQCFYWGSEKSYQGFLALQKKQNLADEDAMFAETDGENDLEWSSMGYGGLGNTMGFFNID